jgi:hypothetical protein
VLVPFRVVERSATGQERVYIVARVHFDEPIADEEFKPGRP